MTDITKDIHGAPAGNHRTLWNAEAERYSRAPTARFEDDPFLAIVENSGALTPQARVLDLGCGPGIYSVAIASRVKEVMGYDVSEEMLEHARERARNENRTNCTFSVLNWQSADIEALGLVKSFGVSIARLTPAVDTIEDLDKLLECTENRLFFEQFVHREHPWMRLAFEIAGAGSPWRDERTFALIDHLHRTTSSFKLFERQAQWGSEFHPWQDAADFCLRRLALRGPVSEELEQTIRREFERRSVGGFVDAREKLTLVTVDCRP